MNSFRRATFNNATFQAELEDFGFVKVKLLTGSQVDEFLTFYKTELSGFGEGDFLHTHMAPVEVKYKTHSFVKPRIEEPLKDILRDYKVGLGFFMIKPSNGKAPMRVHQDKSLVDEDKYVGLTVWCPLIDVDESNGSLSVVRKSHLFLKNHRGSNIGMPYEAIEDIVEQKEFSQSLTVKAGEAIIFDHRLWHASSSNTTDVDRVVVAAVAVPNECSYVHYEKTDTGRLHKFSAPDDFPLKFDVNAPLSDNCKLENDSILPNKDLTEKEFLSLYKKFHPSKNNTSLWKRLLSNLRPSY